MKVVGVGQFKKGGDTATPPNAVLSGHVGLPDELAQLLHAEPDGPVIAAMLDDVFGVAGTDLHQFAFTILADAQRIQNRAAEVSAEIASRDFREKLDDVVKVCERLAASGLIATGLRWLANDSARKLLEAENDVASLVRSLDSLRPVVDRLRIEAANASGLLSRTVRAISLARPWLDPVTCDQRLRLIKAASSSCALVEPQAEQLALHLEEVRERSNILMHVTLPSLRNAYHLKHVNL